MRLNRIQSSFLQPLAFAMLATCAISPLDGLAQQAAVTSLFAPPQLLSANRSAPTQPAYANLLAAAQPTPAAEPLPAPKPAPTPEVVSTPLVESTEMVISETETLSEPMADPLEGDISWYSPAYWFGPTPWDSGIELGLNGSGGTSESLSFRTGGFVKRKNDDYKFKGSLYYNKTETEGVEIQSNALFDVRYDWLFGDSPWTIFIMSQTFYDEFQAFDINVNANSGIGYQWVDKDWTKLSTSVGSGASREFGSIGEEWVPEANFGVEYELQFTETKKFYAKVDYFPEWEDFNRYRVLTDVGMEIELNQPSNISLKLSATDRYDSDPQGVEPRNLNYSALLIWKL